MRLLLCILFLLSTVSLRADDAWPRFGGSAGDSLVSSVKTTTARNEWKREFGTGTGQIVTDGTRLYATSAIPKQGEIGDQELMVALDAATGKTLTVSRIIRLTPSVVSSGISSSSSGTDMSP